MKGNSSVQPNSAASSNETKFYVVSQKKFFILYIGTLGWYEIYWFYKNWKLYKDSSGANIWPIPRVIFNIFFVHALFRLIKEKVSNRDSSFQWNHSSTATIFVVLSIISRALDRLAMEPIISPYLTVLSLAILIPLAFALYQPQAAINYSFDDPEGITNQKFTGTNYFCLAIGACLWAASIQSILIGVMGLVAGDSGF